MNPKVIGPRAPAVFVFLFELWLYFLGNLASVLLPEFLRRENRK